MYNPTRDSKARRPKTTNARSVSMHTANQNLTREFHEQKQRLKGGSTRKQHIDHEEVYNDSYDDYDDSIQAYQPCFLGLQMIGFGSKYKPDCPIHAFCYFCSVIFGFLFGTVGGFIGGSTGRTVCTFFGVILGVYALYTAGDERTQCQPKLFM